MAKKLDLFYILKLNVSTIIENNYNIKTDFKSAKSKGWVVSIGDNQMLKFIRDIKGIDLIEQRNKVKELYELRNNLKSLPHSNENSNQISIYQKEIDKLLYLPDIVSVCADTTKSDYKSVANNKFKINDVVYKRLCAGAGQLRRNTVFFVNEKYFEQLNEIMMCGLDKKRIGKINLSKFSAYHSLYASSTNTITTPRVCVVKDYELILENQKVDWIYTNKNGERDIEERVININQNVWDGSGLVSLEMAEIWDNDLEIKGYEPSAYIIRSAWIKGLCIRFDWKKFAREVAKKDYIIDAWGKVKKIDDVDIIISTSQFKMWKKYNDWEEYVEHHEKYGHVWGCSRVNKKVDNFLTTLNYQYIQSNFFTEDSIKKLADFSIDWVKKVSTGERIYVLLYLLGCHESDKEISEVERSSGMSIVKALMYNENILNDSYVRNRIYKSIEKKINQLKIGKIFVEGSYEFAMVDPYMYCEYIFGLEPKGLLEAGQLWNKRWVDKGSKEVAVLRSPLVAPSENQVLEVYSNDRCEEWYSTVKSGVILNGWDTTLMRASDGDTDGDLLLTTDNIQFCSAVDRSLNPITYDKAMVDEQYINYRNLVNMDTKSFNTKIGVITNLATSLICLRDQYDKNDSEYKELSRRINLLRFHQGSAIDAGKGNLYIAPPREWSKKTRVDYENDSDEIKKSKYYYNKLVGDKKSYFMCYIYPSLMKDYKGHKESSKRICRAMFGCRIDEIFKKKDRNKSEKKFIRNYYKYLPVFTNKSIMNILCWHVENADVDLKFFKTNKEFDYKVLMNSTTQVHTDSKMYSSLLNVIKKYHSIYELNAHERKYLEEEYGYTEDEDDRDEEFSALFSTIESELFGICSNRNDLCNYLVHIMYNHFKNKSKAILWNICGDQIVNNLKSKADVVYFPVESNELEGVEYLGKWYKLQEVFNLDNI